MYIQFSAATIYRYIDISRYNKPTIRYDITLFYIDMLYACAVEIKWRHV